MAWIADSNELIRERAQAAWRLPMGLASPLWVLYGAAAFTGATYWWLTRFGRPVNIEAAGVIRVPVAEPGSPDESEPPTPAEPAADDLTRLTGIGPKLSA